MLIVGVFSDQHCNSTVGLIHPTAYLNDGGTYYSSRGQGWLWDCYTDFCRDFHSRPGARYGVIVGDTVELDHKKRSTQTVTQDRDMAIENAVRTFAPFVEPCERVFWIRGTEAHGGPRAEAESLLANSFKNTEKTPGPYGRRPLWSELQAEWGGFLFDVAHHTTGDLRSWTRGGAMMRLVVETIVRCTERGDPIPNVLLRAHMHQYRDSEHASPVCRAITLPCWTLATEYVYRLGKPGVADVGGLIITIGDSRMDIQVKRYPFEKGLRPIWRAKDSR